MQSKKLCSSAQPRPDSGQEPHRACEVQYYVTIVPLRLRGRRMVEDSVFPEGKETIQSAIH